MEMEDEVPVAIPLEGLDWSEGERGCLHPSLIPQDPTRGLFRMLSVVQIVVRKEPALFSIVTGGISVTHKENLAIREETDIGHELVNLAPLRLHCTYLVWHELRIAGLSAST